VHVESAERVADPEDVEAFAERFGGEGWLRRVADRNALIAATLVCMGNTSDKKPPAPSAKTRTLDVEAQIARQIFTAFERLGADPEFLSIINSWRDTLDDEEVLWMLKEYNSSGKVLHRPQ
jgi:hypothetical protein